MSPVPSPGALTEHHDGFSLNYNAADHSLVGKDKIEQKNVLMDLTDVLEGVKLSHCCQESSQGSPGSAAVHQAVGKTSKMEKSKQRDESGRTDGGVDKATRV